MPEISGRELIREWRKLTDAMVEALSSVAGRSEVPRQIAEPMQRQLELVQDLIDRERRLQEARAALERRGPEHGDRLVTYPDTGHISLRPPGVPTTVLRSGELAFGGTAAGFFDAMQVAWPEILGFFSESLSD